MIFQTSYVWFLPFLLVLGFGDEIFMVPCTTLLPYAVCDLEDPLNYEKMYGPELDLVKIAIENTDWVRDKDYYWTCYEAILLAFYFQDQGENMLIMGENAIFVNNLLVPKRYTQVKFFSE